MLNTNSHRVRSGFTLADSMLALSIMTLGMGFYTEAIRVAHQRLNESQVQLRQSRSHYEEVMVKAKAQRLHAR